MLKELNKTYHLQDSSFSNDKISGVAQSFQGLVGSINDGTCDHKFIAVPVDPNNPGQGFHIVPVLYFVGASDIKNEQHRLQFYPPFTRKTVSLDVIQTDRKKAPTDDFLKHVVDEFDFLKRN